MMPALSLMTGRWEPLRWQGGGGAPASMLNSIARIMTPYVDGLTPIGRGDRHPQQSAPRDSRKGPSHERKESCKWHSLANRLLNLPGRIGVP